MDSLSKKIYLQLNPPTDDDTLGDKDRILNSLKDQYENIEMPYKVVRSLYPLCRNCDFNITVTLVKREYDWVITKVESGDRTSEHYGLAVDLGSTTVIMELVDLNTGKVILGKSTFNRQIKYGDDILTRIFYTKEKKTGIDEIQKSTIESFVELMKEIEEESKINIEDISIMVVAGNTTMNHFLLGIDPWTIFQSPYTPVFNKGGFIEGRETGLPMNGYLYLFPSVANYLGGDIVSGLLYTEIYKKEELSAFIDIGTNGELVMGNEDFLVAAAGAAGPALEGGISKYGMRAAGGAIDTIKIIDNKIKYTTIENEKPRGICGSGIVDLLSEMFLNGWIDFSGTLIPEKSLSIIKLEEEYAVEYATKEESENNESLIFTQNDIVEFLRTKSAANTMVAYLLEEIGLDLNRLDGCYVAGAFGTHLDIKNAVTIGMYPDLLEGKILCPGNTSLKGARKLLINRELLNEVEEIVEKVEYLRLSNATDFVGKMRAASFIPHTNLEMYPSVKEELIRRGMLK